MRLLELDHVQSAGHNGAVSTERLVYHVDRALVEVDAVALALTEPAAESEDRTGRELETVVNVRRSGELDPHVPQRLVLLRGRPTPGIGSHGRLRGGGYGEVSFGRDNDCHAGSLARHFFRPGSTY